MLKTLWTVTAAGLLALCMTGCGGGSDDASKICDRLNSCGLLSQVGASSVADCKPIANQRMSGIPANMKSQVDQAIDGCLALTCPNILTCLNTLGPGTTTAAPSTGM